LQYFYGLCRQILKHDCIGDLIPALPEHNPSNQRCLKMPSHSSPIPCAPCLHLHILIIAVPVSITPARHPLLLYV
jgi:hypothetical protein